MTKRIKHTSTSLTRKNSKKRLINSALKTSPTTMRASAETISLI